MLNVLRILSFFIIIFSELIYGQNFWQPVKGFSGGKIKMLGVDNNNSIYAGTIGGLYQSTDLGKTWSLLKILSGGRDIGSVNIKALLVNATLVYVATDSGSFHSTDYGNSWTKMGSSLPFYVTAFARNNIGLLVAGTESGLYRSTDDGSNWTQINGAGQYMNVRCLLVLNNEFYAGGLGSSIVYSVNSGTTWSDLNTSIQGNVNDMKADTSGNIIAASGNGAVYRSTTYGYTWTTLDSIGDNASVNSLFVDTSGTIYAGVGKSSADSAGDPKHYGFYLSMDNGRTWIQRNNNLSNTNVNSIAVINARTVIAGTDKGISKSENLGADWTESNSGIEAVSVSAIIPDTLNGLYVLAGNDIKYSNDDGNTWNEVNDGLNGLNILFITRTSRGNIYACTSDGIFQWNSSLKLWEKFSDNINKRPVYSIAEDSKDFLYASTGIMAYRSTDHGKNWTELSTIPTALFNGCYVFNDTVFIPAYNGLYRSVDHGEKWETVISEGRISKIAKANGILYASEFSAQRDFIIKSTDNGNTWLGMPEFRDLSFSSVITDPNAYVYIVLSESRIMRSTDNGRTWTNINYNLPKSYWYQIAINSKGYFFIGTYSSGLFRSTKSLAKSITLINPKSGEKWLAGSVQDIKWDSQNLENIKIEYSIDNGKNWLMIKNSTPASTGKFTWTVADTASDSCKVRIGDITDLKIKAESISPFSIIKSPNRVEQISNQIPEKYALYQNYPNPFNPSTTIKYSIIKSGHVEIKVYDITGKTVAVLLNEEQNPGTYTINFISANIPSGIYIYRIISGQFSEARKLAVLK